MKWRSDSQEINIEAEENALGFDDWYSALPMRKGGLSRAEVPEAEPKSLLRWVLAAATDGELLDQEEEGTPEELIFRIDETTLDQPDE